MVKGYIQMKNLKLEYVISGTSYIRLNHSYFIRNKDCISKFKEMLAILKKSSSHNISALFNAWVESDYGERYAQSGIDKDFHRIYTDSGGLQLVTRGIAIDDTTKDKIYNVQNKYSSVAMCFDEIPVGIIGESSKRNDYEFRYFDKAMIEEKAKLTGLNINDQINFFKKNSKDGNIPVPVVIVHGQDYDSYMKWSENILNVVDKSNHQYMKCVAISSAAGGAGPLEEIRKYFLFKFLPFEHMDHFHILGVGSVRRMAPLLLLMQKGMFDDMTVSYDSTTHSSSPVMGQYYNKEGKKMTLGRPMNENYPKIYEELNQIFGVPYSIDEFYNSLTTSITGYEEKFNNDGHVVTSAQLVGMGSMYNFVKEIETYLHDHDKLLTLFRKDVKLYKYLYDNVHTLDDYMRWEKDAVRHLKSLKISVGKKDTLESMFE